MGKKFALIFGWVFLIIGILGFIPNPIVGLRVDTIFFTDTPHNIVHIISGLVFLFVAYKASSKSAMTLKVFGVVYLLVTILGFFSVNDTSGVGSILGVMAINTADNWLHVVLGLGALLAGIKASKDMGRTM